MSRPVRPIPDAASLRAAALHYLARFAASSHALRRVLRNKVYRAAQQNSDLDPGQIARLHEEIDRIVADCLSRRYLDDAVFAAQQIRRARAGGKSIRFATAKLAQQGFASEQIAAAGAAVAAETATDAAEADLDAALRLARRRKLGPFGGREADRARTRRDVAILARAGFSPSIIRRVLRALPGEEDDMPPGIDVAD